MEEGTDFMRAFVDADHDYEYDLLLDDPELTSLEPFDLLIPIDPAILRETAAAAEVEISQEPSADLSPDPFAEAIAEALAEHSTTTASSEPAPNNPVNQMPPPPTDQAFGSETEARSFVNNFTAQHGYACVTKNSKTDKDGEIKVRHLRCNRGGTYKDEVDEKKRKRKTTTRREDCPFKIILRRDFESKTWRIEVSNPEHNHEGSPVHTHPTLRAIQVKALYQTITSQLNAGISPRQILESARQNDSNILLPRDIYNLRQKLYHQFLDGRPPIQALLTVLPKEGQWLFNHMTDNEDRLVGLFGTHKTCLELLQKSPYVLLMDCTYKTNKYKMPLLDINGVTATGSSFYAGFAFLHNEQQSSYDFAVQNLFDVYNQLGIPPPCTILTDKEPALINACTDIFPTTDILICLWHVNQNILSKARPFLRKDLLDRSEEAPDPKDKKAMDAFHKEVQNRWRLMLAEWWKVLRAATPAEATEEWKNFRAKYSDDIFTPLVNYIEKEWLNKATKRRILFCYTNNSLHFDMRTTSRGEGSHARLKKDLGTSIADHVYVIQSFSRTINHLHDLCNKKIDEQRIKKPTSLLKTFLFGNVLTKVSQTALARVLGIYQRHYPLKSSKKPIPEVCTAVTRVTMGLPCIHVIRQRVERQQSLKPEDFHQQWHLYLPADMPPPDPEAIVLEPRVVTAVRGRPAGSSNNMIRPPPLSSSRPNRITGTNREPSEFERVLDRENQPRRGRPPSTNQSVATPRSSSPAKAPEAESESEAELKHGFTHESEEISNEPLLPNMAPPSAPRRKRARQPARNVRSSSPDPLAEPASQRSRYGRRIRRLEKHDNQFEYH